MGVQMEVRPPTSGGRPPTSLRPPTTRGGTASRLISAARPGSRTGSAAAVGVGVASHINIADRPMSQQGLATPRTNRAPQRRQVQDKSYYMGLLRAKIGELTAEISTLTRELELRGAEQATYATYERRAEALAAELKELQGHLADYNLLVDKLNTDTEVSEVLIECSDLKLIADREAQMVEQLFEHRQEKEKQVKQLELELEQERHMTDNLIEAMKPELKEKYNQMKGMNQAVLEQQEQLQLQIDTLTARKVSFEEELSLSQMKQEVFTLVQRLRELEEKRDSLMEEDKARGTPAQERERLLHQVKEDNAELASMERQAAEVREQMARAREELEQIESERAGQRADRYLELKRREQTMEQFLSGWEQSWAAENSRRTELEQKIVSLLESVSRGLAHFHNLPSPAQFDALRQDLVFKEGEMEKSRSTASTLEQEQSKLTLDLQKIEQLEAKIETEMSSLQQRMQTMEEDMAVFSDLELLRKNAEMKRQDLSAEKNSLVERKAIVLEEENKTNTEYEALRTKLAENEAWTQLNGLQRRWQHLEHNNHSLRELVATRRAETDFSRLREQALSAAAATNKILQECLQAS
ncbi:IFT74 [Cordylochernes scorpioides]|uniref:IFT74 n=1 Tax=Cordylochernes scorpioides TaxID=51811 RepID=A0ABY6LN29_9ARAC|nr:IFT74 [Cordylochernes scorpioides]